MFFHRVALVFFSILLLISGFCKGQLLDNIDKSLKTKPKFFLTLASFNTFIDGDFASFDGFKSGLTYNERIRFSSGFFQLANNGVVTPINVTENSFAYATNGQLELFFFPLSAEYFFHNDYPWLFSAVPFNLALGSAHYEYISRLQGKRVSGPSEFIVLYQPEVTAQYNVIRWFGFGVSTGYRFTLLRSKQQTRNLDGINFSVDFRLMIDELYDELISSK